jgi:hypothetical protein
MTTGTDRFAPARAVADAVLYEGYVLYPYRASARKNQLRWQFGVLVPPSYSCVDPSERAAMRTEVLVRAGDDPVLTVRVRFLQVQRREIERAGTAGYTPAPELDVDGRAWVPWDEAVEHEATLDPVALRAVVGAAVGHPFAATGGCDTETLVTARGELAGRAVRHRRPVSGVVGVGATPITGTDLLRIRVDVANTTVWDAAGAGRDTALTRSLVAVHALLAIDGGEFVSLLDPPADAVEAAAGCSNDGTYPVLAGYGDATDLVLSAPIILYDHPAVAPESDGDFCDATEIDEILALRVLTLTDDEKAEARGTDPRAAEIIDRCDEMPPEVWERLHGAVRSIRPVPEPADPDASEQLPWWEPGVDSEVDPWTDTTWIGGVEVGKGTAVRLRPSRRADAQDLFLAGELASVAGVFRDVDGNEHVAVTLDNDPAAELYEWQRRFLYFHPDEIEVVVPEEGR